MDAGIGKEGVDLSKCGRGFSDGIFNIRVLFNIARHKEQLVAVKLCRKLCSRVGIAVHKADIPAFSDKLAHCGPADAGRAAGNKYGFYQDL